MLLRLDILSLPLSVICIYYNNIFSTDFGALAELEIEAALSSVDCFTLI